MAVSQTALTSAWWRRRRGASCSGFSLIEVVVAVSLLALSGAAVTACVSGAERGVADANVAGTAQQLVRDTLERLRGLPLYNVERAATSNELQLGPCAVAELFPHALPERNTAEAYYVNAPTGDAPAGTFITETRNDGVTLRTTARFVVWTSSGWSPVALSSLQKYAVWNARRLPAAALWLTVCATWHENGRQRSYELAAILEGTAVPSSGSSGTPSASQ